MELDTSSPKKETIENQYNVQVIWQHENMPWNEICSNVMEVFGLPGDRYTFSPTTHYMLFKFKSKKDQLLCELLLSEYINV